jgi:hypothetical protein
MKGNPVGWFEIYVDNMDRAKRFYESVFGVSLEKLESPGVEMWSFRGDMNSYGVPGALVKMQGFSAGKNSVVVYFSCADCSLEEGRVVGCGGTVVKSKFGIGQHGFISLVTDTEGNMIGLHSME